MVIGFGGSSIFHRITLMCRDAVFLAPPRVMIYRFST